MKILLFAIFAVFLAVAGGLFWLAQQSKKGAPPGLIEGRLAPCPATPNCVTSESHADERHRTDAFATADWERLPQLIENAGGIVVSQEENYIAATFRSSVFGFVDDVEFRNAGDAIEVRSASRVGHGDMGANRKRVEALRSRLYALNKN